MQNSQQLKKKNLYLCSLSLLVPHSCVLYGKRKKYHYAKKQRYVANLQSMQHSSPTCLLLCRVNKANFIPASANLLSLELPALTET